MLRPVLLRLSLFQFYQVPTRCRGLSSSVNKRKFSGDQNYIDVRWLWNEKELKLTPPQGGVGIKKRDLGSNFFFQRREVDLPTT